MRTDAFDEEEYESAKKVITEEKNPGEDGIPPEVLKRWQLDDIIIKFCNDALLPGRKPAQWSTLNLIPIPKSGDLREGKNYRGSAYHPSLQKPITHCYLTEFVPTWILY